MCIGVGFDGLGDVICFVGYAYAYVISFECWWVPWAFCGVGYYVQVLS